MYLHNLAHLDLVDPHQSADPQLTPPFSHPLQKLSVTEFTDLDFIDHASPSQWLDRGSLRTESGVQPLSLSGGPQQGLTIGDSLPPA